VPGDVLVSALLAVAHSETGLDNPVIFTVIVHDEEKKVDCRANLEFDDADKPILTLAIVGEN
jgi:hypothetical protein